MTSIQIHSQWGVCNKNDLFCIVSTSDKVKSNNFESQLFLLIIAKV